MTMPPKPDLRCICKPKEPHRLKEHRASAKHPLTEPIEPVKCGQPPTELSAHKERPGESPEPPYYSPVDPSPNDPIDYGPPQPERAGPPRIEPDKPEVTAQAQIEVPRQDYHQNVTDLEHLEPIKPETIHTGEGNNTDMLGDNVLKAISVIIPRVQQSIGMGIIKEEVNNSEHFIKRYLIPNIKKTLNFLSKVTILFLKQLRQLNKNIHILEKPFIYGLGTIGGIWNSYDGLTNQNSMTNYVIKQIFSNVDNAFIHIFLNATIGFALTAGSVFGIIKIYKLIKDENRKTDKTRQLEGSDAANNKASDDTVAALCTSESDQLTPPAETSIDLEKQHEEPTGSKPEECKSQNSNALHSVANLRSQQPPDVEELTEPEETKLEINSSSIASQIEELQRQLAANQRSVDIIRKAKIEKLETLADIADAERIKLLGVLESTKRELERTRDFELFALGITALQLNHEMEKTDIPEIMWDSALRIRARIRILLLDKKFWYMGHPLQKDSVKFGKYTCEHIIGKGGMGLVYLAKDTEARHAIIKTLSLELQNGSDREKNERYIVREASLLEQIKHQHVIQIYEHGRVTDENTGEEIFYLAAEFIDGVTLERFLDEFGPLPLDETMAVLYMAASGLEAIHANDIVHEDVKPGNMMLTHEATVVKVIDLNLARGKDDTVFSTAVLGTVGYMAPEKIKGQPETDEQELGRADVYSFGMTAYRAITGRPRYIATDRDTRQILNYSTFLDERDNAFDSDSLRDIPEGLREPLIKMGIGNPKKRDITFTQIKEALMAQYLEIRGQKPDI
ncbi:MAG: serine/threonine-protein kinase [archaeon]